VEKVPAEGETFHTDQKCRASGIYSVIHDKNHVLPHDVTMIKGRTFPPCRGCENRVQFKLKYAAQHIDSNEWLNGQKT
jgi:hypothetical protein